MTRSPEEASQAIRVAVAGLRGRMAGEIIRLILDAQDLVLAGGTLRDDDPDVGRPVGEVLGLPTGSAPSVARLEDLVGEADVVVDFTTPGHTMENVKACGEAGIPAVIGTTGLGEEGLAAIEEAARAIAVVQAPNMSRGAILLLRLTDVATGGLDEEFDAEVIELHHREKREAPSGTALALVDRIRKARRSTGEVRHGRYGQTGPRPAGEIGVHSLRGGDGVGEHTVLFLGSGERLILTHRADRREAFAWGALQAVRFVVKASPGLYSMEDVLTASRVT